MERLFKERENEIKEIRGYSNGRDGEEDIGSFK